MNDVIRWITYNGRRIPIKQGMKGKFDKQLLNKVKDERKKPITYNSEIDGKLTRNKLKDYVEKVKNRIEWLVDNDDYYKEYTDVSKRLIKGLAPDYDNVYLNMKVYGLAMKDIKTLEFIDERYDYEIEAVFNNGLKMNVFSCTKY